MNNDARWELEQLKRRQARLESELAALTQAIARFERQFPQGAVPQKPATPPPLPPVITPPPLPPEAPLSADPRLLTSAATKAATSAATETAKESKATVDPRLLTSAATKESADTRSGEKEFGAPPVIPPASKAKPEERSFEMLLGRHWAPRVGIILVLTAFVFFANYAYQNFIGKLGPAGKVALLYFGGAILLGAGTWWQRKGVKDSLRNYAQVLFAGGLAAVYFTTYAAHHIENLRIITNPQLDGILLLAWTGFMVWIADRKKSEVLALFGIGLAYYTSVITRVGMFTLYSNLLLTAAAVFFLVRNRWAGLSFTSLIATYAGYAFWRFYDGRYWNWTSPEQGLWHGTYFLAAYWIVFTAAVFLCRDAKFAGRNRATFLTLNNVQFFVLYLLTLLQARGEWFWKFALAYGAVLLGLAVLARRVFPDEPHARNFYLTQGLLLVTAGIIAKFAGLQLALLLALESVVLFTLGRARRDPILETGAFFCGAMSVGWGIDGLERDNWRGALTVTAIGALMVFNALWVTRPFRNATPQPGKTEPPAPPSEKPLVRAVPAFFVVLALISWLAATAFNFSFENLAPALAVEALVLTLSIHVLRLRELSLFGQSFLVIAHFAWLIRFAEREILPPWWNPALILAITVGLSHWWQRQRFLPNRAMNEFWQALYALAVVGLLFYWIEPLVTDERWLVLSSALAIVLTAYGLWTRWWWVAGTGQLLLGSGVLYFAFLLIRSQPRWPFALAPLIALLVLASWTTVWFRRRTDASSRVREPLLTAAMAYRCVATVMALCWVWEYIPVREQIWVLIAIGAGLFAFHGLRGFAPPAARATEESALYFSAVFTFAGAALFWLPLHGAGTVYTPNLLAIGILLAQQQAARRIPSRYAIHEAVHAIAIVLGALSLALLMFRWLSESAHSFYLTAGWSVLGLILFAAGMILRERVYRWVGLVVLAFALGRVALVDVWKLNELYRILSFAALGLVLLILGFVYSKYQEKIKEWL